jgi:hypothetical protein
MTREKENGHRIDASICLVNRAAILKYWRLQEGSSTALVKRSLAKKYVLDVAKHTRYHPFSRVRGDALLEVCMAVRLFLDKLSRKTDDEAVLEYAAQEARRYCHSIVLRNPSVGKTLK